MSTPQTLQVAASNLAALRKTAPLVHNITNFVVMDLTANALLSMGASPVMAHAENEVEEMVRIADALVLNIGTLTDAWIDVMLKAGTAAAELNKPIVLDPVGAGATRLRTESARRLLDLLPITVIRGNASEIMALRPDGEWNEETRGVDSAHSVSEAAQIADAVALKWGTTVAVTGAVDRITDGQRILLVENGHPLMSRVTGTGCSATAAIGAFLAVDPDPLTAAASALAFLGVAGETAAIEAKGPGSFRTAFIDSLFQIIPDDLRNVGKISSGNQD